MRFFSSLLSLALLATGALAATKKTPAERFNQFHARSQNHSPLKLNELSYKSVTAAPRDYSVAVLLTALDARYGCSLCRDFQPEWDLISKSWAKGDKSGQSRMLYGTLDFADGREIFMSLGLQTAPVLLLFQPTQGPHAAESQEPLRYDFTSGPPTAEQVHSWVTRHLPDRPHPSVKRPINWMAWFTSITIALAVGATVVTASRFLMPVITNRNVWASISLIVILLFTSGHMFNHIRKVPYVAGDGRGGINYIAPGFQSQFGMETQIVAALYGLLSFCVISLTYKVPRVNDSRTQQVAVISFGALMFIVYSFLLSVFRIKNGGYPFSLPPFM